MSTDLEDRPAGWEQTVKDLISANFDYENTNAALKKKFSDIGLIGSAEYRRLKAAITGGAKADEKIHELGEQKRVKKAKKLPEWDKKKQAQADGSALAHIINSGVYQGMMPFCATQNLKEEDVQEINPGGAIVANVNYYLPDTKLEHPLVLLGIRIVILYLKFKSVCSEIKEVAGKSGGGAHGLAGATQGLKPGMKTDMRK
jgi:hypothetical protein